MFGGPTNLASIFERREARCVIFDRMHFGLMEGSYLLERTAQQRNRRRIGVLKHAGFAVGDQERFSGSPKNVAILALIAGNILFHLVHGVISARASRV